MMRYKKLVKMVMESGEMKNVKQTTNQP